MRAVSVLRQQAGDYLSLRAGNHLVCRGRTYALPFICHLQMPRLYRAKLLNDIDDVCGDMDLIEGIDLALDVSDPHGAHLTMSHDNDIDRAWIPINYCPICGRNFRKDR